VFETAQLDGSASGYAQHMSALNGDRARFHKDRKRKLQHRQRIQALAARLRKQSGETNAKPVGKH
jgi:hypothetical protein